MKLNNNMIFVCEKKGKMCAFSQYAILNYEPYNWFFTAVKETDGILLELGINHRKTVKWHFSVRFSFKRINRTKNMSL